MRETRIRLEFRGDGTTLYYPQYKHWIGLWASYKTFQYDSYQSVCCDTLEDAQAVINADLKRQQYNKVIGCEYVKYP